MRAQKDLIHFIVCYYEETRESSSPFPCQYRFLGTHTCVSAHPYGDAHRDICACLQQNASCLFNSYFIHLEQRDCKFYPNQSVCLSDCMVMKLLLLRFNQSHPKALWCELPREAEVLPYIIRKTLLAEDLVTRN